MIDIWAGFFYIAVATNNSPLKHTDFVYEVSTHYLSSAPKPILTFDQHLKTFTLNVWLALALTLLLISLTCFLIHFVYDKKIDPKYGLAGPVVHKADFVILVLASITEPDPLPWFPKKSAGWF